MDAQHESKDEREGSRRGVMRDLRKARGYWELSILCCDLKESGGQNTVSSLNTRALTRINTFQGCHVISVAMNCRTVVIGHSMPSLAR